MSRRKPRPSRWIVGAFLVCIAYGIGAERWQPLLFGIGGISTMFFGWLAFRSRVPCDVRKVRGGFCKREIRGILFGCGDHHWDKVLAWSRYVGTGYIARALHLNNFPILRWQVDAGQAAPVQAKQSLRLSYSQPPPPVAGKAGHEYTPPQFIQVLIVYVTLLSGLASLAGLGLSIAQLPK